LEWTYKEPIIEEIRPQHAVHCTSKTCILAIKCLIFFALLAPHIYLQETRHFRCVFILTKNFFLLIVSNHPILLASSISFLEAKTSYLGQSLLAVEYIRNLGLTIMVFSKHTNTSGYCLKAPRISSPPI
jgi:hypothetical protein